MSAGAWRRNRRPGTRPAVVQRRTEKYGCVFALFDRSRDSRRATRSLRLRSRVASPGLLRVSVVPGQDRADPSVADDRHAAAMTHEVAQPMRDQENECGPIRRACASRGTVRRTPRRSAPSSARRTGTRARRGRRRARSRSAAAWRASIRRADGCATGARPRASMICTSLRARLRPAGSAALAPDQQVLRDGQIGEELRLLMDDETRLHSIARRPGAAVERQRSRASARSSPADDADERATCRRRSDPRCRGSRRA